MDLLTIFINISFALTLLVLIIVYVMLRMRDKVKQINLDLNAALQKNEKIHRFLDHSETIIYTHDLSGKIDYVNATIHGLLGYNPDQLIGTSFSTIIQQDHPQNWENYIQAIFRDKSYQCNFKLLDTNGHAIPFHIRASGITEEGVVVAVKGHARKLTTDEAKEVFNHGNEKSTNELKSFVQGHQVFAHHIKNIFTAIYGFVEILEEDGQKGDNLEVACQEIRAASTKGMRLVGEYSVDPGTNFHSAPAKFDTIPRDIPQIKEKLKTGHGRILYIDDEESLLKMYAKFIQKLGYTVDICSSGVQALAMLSSEKEPYGLIISDWMMPDINGAELVKRVQEKHQDIPIMLLSGKNISQDERPPVSTILEKPVDPAILSDKIYQLLMDKQNP